MVCSSGKNCDGGTQVSELGNNGWEREGGQRLYSLEGQRSERREMRVVEGAPRECRAAGEIFLERGGGYRNRKGSKVMTEGVSRVC